MSNGAQGVNSTQLISQTLFTMNYVFVVILTIEIQMWCSWVQNQIQKRVFQCRTDRSVQVHFSCSHSQSLLHWYSQLGTVGRRKLHKHYRITEQYQLIPSIVPLGGVNHCSSWWGEGINSSPCLRTHHRPGESSWRVELAKQDISNSFSSRLPGVTHPEQGIGIRLEKTAKWTRYGVIEGRVADTAAGEHKHDQTDHKLNLKQGTDDYVRILCILGVTVETPLNYSLQASLHTRQHIMPKMLSDV